MAVLGFILGLGLLIPLPSEPPSAKTRDPANDENTETPFVFLHPEMEVEKDAEVSAVNAPPGVDRRPDLLFDIHTVSKSAMANDTNAWIQTKFVRVRNRLEIHHFTYCTNYDFNKARPDTTMNRYAIYPEPRGYPCFRLDLEDLARGKPLLISPFGPILSLRTSDFSPERGGTLWMRFAYRVSLFGKNDEREMRLKITLERGKAILFDPDGYPSEWLTLTMHEKKIGVPDGVETFEFFSRSRSNGILPGNRFPPISR